MRRACVFFILFVAVSLFISTRAFAAFTPPPIAGYVTDPTGRLTPSQIAALDKKLSDYRKCSKNHVAVFIAPSLEDSTIEDAAYATASAWHVGEAKLDSGVLLFIAPVERKVRIETGKGAEGALPDLRANDILREHVSPHLKANDFVAAVDDGTTSIGLALGGCAIDGFSMSAPVAITTPSASPTSSAVPPPPSKPKVYEAEPPRRDYFETRVVLTLVVAALAALFGASRGGIVNALFIGVFVTFFFFILSMLVGSRMMADFDIDAVYALFAFSALALVVANVIGWMLRIKYGTQGAVADWSTSSTGSSDASSFNTFDSWSSSSSSTTSSFDTSSSTSSSSDTSYSGGGGTFGGGGSSDSY